MGTTQSKKINLSTFNHLYPSKPKQILEHVYSKSICYDEQNQRFVMSDYVNHHIQIYDPKTLKCLYMFGSYGDQPGQFSFPTGLCIQPFTRYLLVCDDDNHRIQVFSGDVSNYSFLYELNVNIVINSL